jgi:exopolyphosphatase/guanosine-5'-triphosphate,3'-diphosphate pyrophosphatase
MRVSILDLGSNSYRLLVADVASEGAIRPVLRAREFLRLGSEIASDGSLAEDVIKRAEGAAGHLAEIASCTGAEQSIAVATSPIRDASNCEEGVDRLQQAAGMPIRVIDGQEEARVSSLGVAASIALPLGPHLVLDLGGGSLELAVGSGATPVWTDSADLGVSRLHADCVRNDPLSGDDIARLQQRVGSRLEPIVPQVAMLHPGWTVSVGGPNRALVQLSRRTERLGRPRRLPDLDEHA